MWAETAAAAAEWLRRKIKGRQARQDYTPATDRQGCVLWRNRFTRAKLCLESGWMRGRLNRPTTKTPTHALCHRDFACSRISYMWAHGLSQSLAGIAERSPVVKQSCALFSQTTDIQTLATVPCQQSSCGRLSPCVGGRVFSFPGYHLGMSFVGHRLCLTV